MWPCHGAQRNRNIRTLQHRVVQPVGPTNHEMDPPPSLQRVGKARAIERPAPRVQRHNETGTSQGCENRLTLLVFAAFFENLCHHDRRAYPGVVMRE